MYIVFDIGGTKTRFAASEDGKTLGEPIIRATPFNWDEAATMLAEVCRTLSEGKQITAVVGGLPGVIDRENGTLLRSPNLPEWVGRPVRDTLATASKATVTLYNDTAIVGMGECVSGVGKGYSIVVYVTISTGVGGVRIVDGAIDEFRYGFEPGHQIINADTMLSLEDAVSGTAFQKKFGADFVHTAPQSAWEEAARSLSIGLHNTIVHWSPDVLILGGSMITKSPGIPAEAVVEHVKRILSIFPKTPELKVASLGDIGGLHGALALASK